MIDILYDEKNLRDLRVYATTSLRDLREMLYEDKICTITGNAPK